MTEKEWLASADPVAMLEQVCATASERKLRLFACACCREFWDLLTDPRSRAAVETNERYADGQANDEELLTAWNVATGVVLPAWLRIQTAETQAAEAGRAATRGLTKAYQYLQQAARRASWTVWSATMTQPGPRRQAEILREIFGSPSHQPAVDPAWLRWRDGAVLKIAQAIYDERRFAELPVLADALADAGCTDETLLAHFRAPQVHYRGCWAVDALLEKT